MPNLESVIAGIPGLAGWEASRQANEARSGQQIQQATSLMALIQHLQAQQQEQRFQQQREALGPNPSPEALVNVATGAASARDTLHYAGQSLDRRAQIAAHTQEAQNRIVQQQQNSEMIHEFRMGRLKNDTDKVAETERFHKESAQRQSEWNNVNAQLRMLGLNIQQQRADQMGAGANKPPSAYEPNPDQPGALRPIVGGPADIKVQAAAAKAQTDQQKVQGLSDDIDTLVQQLTTNPNVAGGRGIISRAGEAVSGFIDPTQAPTDAHLFESRITDLKARVQLLRADRRYSKEAMARMDNVLQGIRPGQNAAVSIATLKDMQQKIIRDAATFGSQTSPPGTDALIYKGYKFPSQDKLDAFKAAGG